MAEALFRKIVTEMGIGTHWQIESAGTWGMEGLRAAESAQIVMKKWGMDLDPHRSRIVNPVIMGSSDLILTMEKGHKEALQIEYPDLAEKLHLLSEMIGEIKNIKDPIGEPLEEFEQTADEIYQILNRGFYRINQLAESGSHFPNTKISGV
jgi:protein-tyrosine-phosphatase